MEEEGCDKRRRVNRERWWWKREEEWWKEGEEWWTEGKGWTGVIGG